MDFRDSSKQQDDLTVVVCGGGHAGHTLAALAGSRPGVEVRWLSLSQADSIQQAMGTDDLQVELVGRGDVETQILRSRPSIITSEPAKCIPGAHMVVFALPAYRHAEYFEQIAPVLEENSVVVGMPGQPGFEIEGTMLLDKHGISAALLCFDILPWACRIVEFGRSVKVLGVKENVTTSITRVSHSKASPTYYLRTMQRLLGPSPTINVADNFFVTNLFPKVHPPIMYGQWRDWDCKPLSSKPLFYNGISEFSADILCKCSDEGLQTAEAIAIAFPSMDMSGVFHIFDWYKKAYPNDINDWSSLRAAIMSCKAYEGLTHPMKEQSDGFVPDFDHRYLREDLPYSLCVVRGIAELAGVETPAIDETITWAQKVLNKEYLIAGSMKGRDIHTTRAPQAYGITSLKELIGKCAGAKRAAVAKAGA